MNERNGLYHQLVADAIYKSVLPKEEQSINTIWQRANEALRPHNITITRGQVVPRLEKMEEQQQIRSRSVEKSKQEYTRGSKNHLLYRRAGEEGLAIETGGATTDISAKARKPMRKSSIAIASFLSSPPSRKV
ncbi:MAG: hypothetical protein KGH79_05020 [Patescibacteria group bacterium]|nr:hypothetical protein [Patescibacteria group bacterium]